MDYVKTALTDPVWLPIVSAAGQQLIELLDGLIQRATRGGTTTWSVAYEAAKKTVFKLLLFGSALTYELLANEVLWRALALALVFSAGTEGANSILKYLVYAKEDKKAVAAQARGSAGAVNLREMQQK
jgi:hypothetical protein